MSTASSSPSLPFSASLAVPARLRGLLHSRDLALFRSVAGRRWPGADQVLPRLSRSADHGLLWFGAAAGMAALGSSARARRAALRGVASLAVASAAINTVGKRAVRRERPILDLVPVVRQLKRRPFTTSFPSGHAASAAAFATGVALESKGWGAVVAPVAVAVAASRVYTGVHYPGDVLAGVALGIGAAFALRGVVPTRGQLPAPGRPPAAAPPLPAGKDLVVVVNQESGTATATASLVREALPLAEVVECAPDELSGALAEAAGRGRALGVCGGDGTVNLAAPVAATHGMPLAVFPGGTLNHFAYDLGIETVHDTAAALTSGVRSGWTWAGSGPVPRGRAGRTATSSTRSAWGSIRSSCGPGSAGRPASAAGPPGSSQPSKYCVVDARWLPNCRESGGRCGSCSWATGSSSGWGPLPDGGTTWRTACWTSERSTAAGLQGCDC